jgi:hypothetical protein
VHGDVVQAGVAAHEGQGVLEVFVVEVATCPGLLRWGYRVELRSLIRPGPLGLLTHPQRNGEVVAITEWLSQCVLAESLRRG